jgi:hypothetical protein
MPEVKDKARARRLLEQSLKETDAADNKFLGTQIFAPRD